MCLIFNLREEAEDMLGLWVFPCFPCSLFCIHPKNWKQKKKRLWVLVFIFRHIWEINEHEWWNGPSCLNDPEEKEEEKNVKRKWNIARFIGESRSLIKYKQEFKNKIFGYICFDEFKLRPDSLLQKQYGRKKKKVFFCNKLRICLVNFCSVLALFFIQLTMYGSYPHANDPGPTKYCYVCI